MSGMSTKQSEHGARRPVSVITGALGAGKTTLLNTALERGELGKVAVIVNEFGSIGIDHRIVEASSEQVALLPGGCLCCTVRSDLEDAIARLTRTEQQLPGTEFDRIVIETSGLAEPSPILQLFSSGNGLSESFFLDTITAVVDATTSPARIEQDSVTRRQIELADKLAINKTQLVESPIYETLAHSLSKANPFAPIARTGPQTAVSNWFENGWQSRARTQHAPPARPAVHDDSIESFSLTWNDRRSAIEIADWLHYLADNYGPRLLRLKGLIKVTESDHALLVNVVQHQVGHPEYLNIQTTESQVVLVTRGLEPFDVQPDWPTLSDQA